MRIRTRAFMASCCPVTTSTTNSGAPLRRNLGVMAPPSEEPRWLDALSSAVSDEWRVGRVEVFDPDEISVIAVAPPLRTPLSRFGNLRLIHSLWAGVEVVLADPGLRTDVPLARMSDPEMERSMALSVTAHVLAYHLHQDEYRRQQTERTWRQIYGVPPDERSILVLGLGSMGLAVVEALAGLGFVVTGMARHARRHPTVDVITPEMLDERLRTTDVLVNVLPLTDETRDILDRDLMARLPRGAAIVNVARGAHLVDAHLIDLLDAGHLRHAFLDVYRTEPLPSDHPFWTHPRVTVIPHMAAPTFPSSGARFVATQLARLESGEPLQSLVDHELGY